MNKLYFLLFFFLPISLMAQQNLISNPSFEIYYGTCPSNTTDVILSESCDTLTWQSGGYCVLKDWMQMYNYPSVYAKECNFAFGFPANWCATYIYPHTDSTCIGLAMAEFTSDSTRNIRDYVQNKLKDSLRAGHHYKFSMWVQLADSLQFGWSTQQGKIAGINSFSALFTDTALTHWQGGNTAFPNWNFTPQVQINTMVTDTQHWVLLTDTFIAAGGERYVTISNFKKNDDIQYQVVINKDSLPAYSYYFIDDVSLIDLDAPEGISTIQSEKAEMKLFPNPTTNKLTISLNKSQIKSIQITDLFGSVMLSKETSQSLLTINTANLPNGIYLLKATDDKGFNHVAKFIKTTN